MIHSFKKIINAYDENINNYYINFIFENTSSQ
ncbi:uncharacterized protein METZ01_LOCUS146917 [marine metagenome]|uniref:Uncharacterized protein n=1 Tax=marine metagenome TaxID=408172 RepID=A0A381ZZB6_9ZZZZ